MSRFLASNPEVLPMSSLDIYFGDNLPILREFDKETFDLIYIDPPFNTGKTQTRKRLKTIRDKNGDRVGFQGKTYKTTELGSMEFSDSFADYLDFLKPRFVEAYRLLSPSGSFFFHIDYREVHYCKVLLDQIFGRECFINEIIWSYDYGARSKKRWSPKHDNILWYVKNPSDYTYRHDDIDRIPYMAPGLVGPEKAAKGKTPTDTWWKTIVSPNGKEKTGYPTQKPLAILSRIVNVHSNPGDRILDFFAGSGTTGEAAVRAGRNAVLIDNHPEAIKVMAERLAFASPVLHDVEQTDQRELPAFDFAKTA
ncbi:MAG: site-specific DNA-methyltransferase [Gammaproteobacteria bacterium]|nr:site-specific DNA-methyltransferase [Gammaproteobacteria bacterium]